MSRQRATLLIVGAGPAGLAAAISLARNGVQDFMIVDAVSIKDEGSRAIAIHAATLEVSLKSCTQPRSYTTPLRPSILLTAQNPSVGSASR